MFSPSKSQTDFAIRVARSSVNSFRANKSAEILANNGMGRVAAGRYQVTTDDRNSLRDWLLHQGIDWKKNVSTQLSRTDTAASRVNEKAGAKNVKATWLKLKVVQGQCHVNRQLLEIPPKAHIEMDGVDIDSVRADYILLVENLEGFTALNNINIEAMPNVNILGIYRGDIKTGQAQSWLKRSGEILAGIKVAAFCDYDPAGIDIALGLKSLAMVLPTTNSLENFQGNAKDYTKQLPQLHRRIDDPKTPKSLKPWTDYLEKRKQGFTQERLVSHSKPFQWVKL